MTGFEALTVEALRGLQRRFDERTAQSDAALAEVRAQLIDMRAQSGKLKRLSERNAELEARLAALESLLLDDRALAGAGQ